MAVDIRSDRFQWQASKYIPNKKSPLRAWSESQPMTMDTFLCEIGTTDCIHLYSFDGKFVKTLLEKGSHDMEIIRRVRWCEEKFFINCRSQ